MKKSKFFVALPLATIATVAPITTTLSSCGAKLNENTQLVYDKAVEYFKDVICSVPHKSNDLAQMRALLTSTIDGLLGSGQTKHDAYGNLYFDIPATKGCEKVKKLVIQGHYDMVWTLADEKDKETKRPIPVDDVEKGEPVIHTKDYKSSLGADDGAGVAIILALAALKDKFNHGTIRCILTADEEPGMQGAAALWDEKENWVKHEEGWDHLLNVDGETAGELYISCAGGYSYKYTVDDFVLEHPEDKLGIYSWKLTISGGRGGHSGVAIKNGIANTAKLAVQIMGYLNNYLYKLNQENAKLIHFDSFENAANVVPGKTEVTFACSLSGKDRNDLNDYLQSLLPIFQKIYPAEKDLKFDVACDAEELKKTDSFLSAKESDAVLTFIDNFIYGIIATAEGGRPLASSNVCPVKLDVKKGGETGEPQFDTTIYSRSEDMNILNGLKELASTNFETLKLKLKGESVVEDKIHDIKISEYDPYVYNPDDKLRPVVENHMRKLGIEPIEERVHGGIECSWWYKFNKQLNQASLGPTIHDVHSPRETLFLNTYKNMVSIVLDTIEGMKNL